MTSKSSVFAGTVNGAGAHSSTILPEAKGNASESVLTEASGHALAGASKPSHAELARVFSYDPRTGEFRRLYSKGWKPAGFIGGHGYIHLGYMWKTYPAHHVAWLLMTGEWPECEIDHRDRVRSNNRWTNLRLADRHGQAGNQSLRRDNTSGIKGVRFQRDKWVASIWQAGKRKHLGCFDTKEEAGAAYHAAAVEFFGEFAHPARRAA